MRSVVVVNIESQVLFLSDEIVCPHDGNITTQVEVEICYLYIRLTAFSFGLLLSVCVSDLQIQVTEFFSECNNSTCSVL